MTPGFTWGLPQSACLRHARRYRSHPANTPQHRDTAHRAIISCTICQNLLGIVGIIIYICNMSKVTALYHIVFCTKSRRKTLPLKHAEDLYRFLWKNLENLGCYLIRIGGIQNHIHLLLDLHPSIALADVVQKIKSISSAWMKSDSRFPDFEGWAAEYYACSIAPEQKNAVAEYIKNQHAHHLDDSLDKEFATLYRYAGKQYDNRDMR